MLALALASAALAYAAIALIVTCALMASDATSNETPALVAVAILSLFWPLLLIALAWVNRPGRPVSEPVK